MKSFLDKFFELIDVIPLNNDKDDMFSRLHALVLGHRPRSASTTYVKYHFRQAQKNGPDAISQLLEDLPKAAQYLWAAEKLNGMHVPISIRRRHVNEGGRGHSVMKSIAELGEDVINHKDQLLSLYNSSEPKSRLVNTWLQNLFGITLAPDAMGMTPIWASGDGLLKAYCAKTVEQARIIGTGSEWCSAYPHTSQYAEEYLAKGNLYSVWIDNKPFMQLYFHPQQIRNNRDILADVSLISQQLTILRSTGAKDTAIDSLVPQATDDQLQALRAIAEHAVLNPINLNGLPDLQKIWALLTPKQIEKTIESINQNLPTMGILEFMVFGNIEPSEELCKGITNCLKAAREFSLVFVSDYESTPFPAMTNAMLCNYIIKNKGKDNTAFKDLLVACMAAKGFADFICRDGMASAHTRGNAAQRFIDSFNPDDAADNEVLCAMFRNGLSLETFIVSCNPPNTVLDKIMALDVDNPLHRKALLAFAENRFQHTLKGVFEYRGSRGDYEKVMAHVVNAMQAELAVHRPGYNPGIPMKGLDI